MLKGRSAELSWPDEECGRRYGSVLMGVQGRGLQSVETYYDKLAQDYDTAVRAWGYCLPEATVEALLKYAGLQQNVRKLSWKCKRVTSGLPTGSPTHGDSPIPVNRGFPEPRYFFSGTPRGFSQHRNYHSLTINSN